MDPQTVIAVIAIALVFLIAMGLFGRRGMR
jgi:hypothetical protein